MIILAIETSCDDTCVAILESCSKAKLSLKILSNIVSSQVKLHTKYGGVYPFLAKREHQKNIFPVFERALKDAGNPVTDLVAVTVGPGLEPCLWVGVNFARALARELKLPIIPINHIEAHILANWLPPIGKNSKLQIPNSKQITNSETQKSKIFPAVCLVVSGGHTQLILMKNIGKYKILGETRDDAAGECFDKVARILGLGYPGGPAISALAETEIQNSKLGTTDKFKTANSKLKIKLPRPMIHQKNYDFSFSGLKTAVLYNYKSQPARIRKTKEYIQAMATETQQAIIDVLISKTLKAAKNYKAKAVILGGGVAANKELRKQFQERIKKEKLDALFLIPPQKFCTDNAAMIGITAFFHFLKKEGGNWKKIKADANLRI